MKMAVIAGGQHLPCCTDFVVAYLICSRLQDVSVQAGFSEKKGFLLMLLRTEASRVCTIWRIWNL